MKRWITLCLAVLMLLSFAACTSRDADGTEVATESAAQTDEALTAHMDEVLEAQNYKGVVYLTHNGEVVYQSAIGKDENGDPLEIDSNMYIGSVSKQFCAAAILMLRDEGKLSVEDTLDQYFPAYTIGKELTLKNLLTMRSGILDMVNQGSADGIAPENTEEENTELIKAWIFEQPLQFEPDSAYAYSNSNFFLLSNIVEQVSGQRYIDFVREHIFVPLGMDRSGFVDEVCDAPSWMKGLTAESDTVEKEIKGLSKGAGDIVTTAPDMAKWMMGLSSGKVISAESYREMTADYSDDFGASYGYGVMLMFGGGVGHGGRIASYSAVDYINAEHDYTLFCASGKNSMAGVMDGLAALLLEDAVIE